MAQAAALVLVVALAALGGTAGARRGSLSTTPSRTGPASRPPLARAAARPAAAPESITDENARPGTPGWRVPENPAMWDRIRGFADHASALHGDRVRLFVSSSSSWHVEAYRTGWYGGDGARLVWRSPAVAGAVQSRVAADPATNMAEALWSPSTVVTVADDWPPGMYLLKLVTEDGAGASYVPLVVRDDASRAAIVIQSAVTTWQAYNAWGGANLYTGRGGKGSTRARVVSFDRPYGGNGSGEFFGREFELVQFVERLGLDVTYWTDVDLHARPQLLANHRALISAGHDEYWSLAMRDGAERARDAGVNLAFLGANAVYRRIRLEPSPLGPDRREVNYRSAREDPLHGIREAEVTTSWREPPAARPESSLVGDFYECNPVRADLVIADASAWVFDGADVRNGDRFPGVVGNEYDRVTPEVPTPATIQVLAHSPVRCGGRRSYADMTYYTAASGAGVFATGTLWWVPHLATQCVPGPPTSVDCRMQRITENVLRAFAAGPAGLEHPSRPNLTEVGIRAGVMHPTRVTGSTVVRPTRRTATARRPPTVSSGRPVTTTAATAPPTTAALSPTTALPTPTTRTTQPASPPSTGDAPAAAP